MNIIQEISEWTGTLPAWQSDAVRRIFTQNDLSAADETEFLAMLRHEHGLSADDEVVNVPVPFSSSTEISSGQSSRIVLKELHSVEHVNALVTGQSMKFAMDGITVVFGENGSGKSGYARIFKHACYARDKGEPILTNVTKPATGKPSAIIELLIDDEHTALRWKLGASASPILSEIAVFDSHCARVFVDNANEVVYLPYGLDVFARLGNLCVNLKAKISAELKAVPVTYGGAQDYGQTVVGNFIRTMNAMSDESQVDALGFLDSMQTQRLEQLRGLVASTKANPPKQRADQLRRTKLRLEQLKLAVTSVATKMSTTALADLRTLQSALDTARQAAALASSVAFASEPLPGTGSDPWRQLFDSAREYSEQQAYRDDVFPVVRDDALCVLCQQPLGNEACDRMRRFGEFVANDSARRLEAAQTTLQTAITDFARVAVDILVNNQPLEDELREHHETLVQDIQMFLTEAAAIKTTVLAQLHDGTPVLGISLPPLDIAEIDAITGSLESQATQFDQADKPNEFAKLVAELAELEDRDRLKKHADDVKEYMRAKKREAKLQKCEKALARISHNPN